MARGPDRVLRSRDDALPDAVAWDALPRGRKREVLAGRPNAQGGLGEELGHNLGKGEGRAVEATIVAVASGGCPVAERLHPVAAGSRNRRGEPLRDNMGLALERLVLGFQQDYSVSEPAAIQPMARIRESARDGIRQ